MNQETMTLMSNQITSIQFQKLLCKSIRIKVNPVPVQPTDSFSAVKSRPSHNHVYVGEHLPSPNGSLWGHHRSGPIIAGHTHRIIYFSHAVSQECFSSSLMAVTKSMARSSLTEGELILAQDFRGCGRRCGTALSWQEQWLRDGVWNAGYTALAKPIPSTDSTPVPIDSASQEFPYFPKHHHQLKTKLSSTWQVMRSFTFKPWGHLDCHDNYSSNKEDRLGKHRSSLGY